MNILDALIKKIKLTPIDLSKGGKLYSKNFTDYFLFINYINNKQSLSLKNIESIIRQTHLEIDNKTNNKELGFDSFYKNLQCFILVECDDINAFKRIYSNKILEIEDDQYYANKFVIPYKTEEDIIEYLKISVPFFYGDNVLEVKTEGFSLDILEQDIISQNRKLRHAVNQYDDILKDKDKKDKLDAFLVEIDKAPEEENKQSQYGEKSDLTSKDTWFISSLTINNFRNASYQKHKDYDKGVTYDLDKVKNGIVTLSGPNGLGKTTFFHALRRFLFGNILLEDNNKSDQPKCIYRNSGFSEQDFFVKICFVNNNGENSTYIRKGYKEKKGDKSKDKNKLMFYGDNGYEDIESDELLSFFNISEKEFDFFMYVPQDKPLEFIVSSKGEKEKSLSSIFGTQKYKDYENLIGTKNRGIIKMIESELALNKEKLKREMEDVNVNFEKDPWIKVEKIKDRVTSLFESLNKIISIKRGNIREIISLLDKISNRIQQIEDWKDKQISNNYTSVFKKLQEEGVLEQIRSILLEIKKIDVIKDEFVKVENDTEVLTKKLNIINNIQEGIDTIEKYNFELIVEESLEISNLRNKVVEFCKLSEKVRAQNDSLSVLEKQIAGILHYVNMENSASCPACMSNFSDSSELSKSISASINDLKFKLDTKERDIILDDLKADAFLNKKVDFEEKIKQLNSKKGILLKISDHKDFASDFIDESFGIVDTKNIELGNNAMYRKLKDIREEYNVYKGLNIQHINMYSEYFKQVLAYEEEKKQKDIYKKIEKLETVRDDLRNYKKYIEGKRSDFETTIVDGLDKYVKKYSKSIIKYNTVGDITLKRGNGISIEVQGENQENSIGSPEFTFSQGQLSGVALSCVLAFYKKILLQKIKLRVLLIDDPIQTIDDLNSLNLINILRYDFDESQVILSTHEDSFDRLIRYKYQVLGKQQKNINMRNL